MAIHIYMSAEPVLMRESIDKRAPYNYRGEAGTADDAQSFKEMMRRRGFDVVLASKGEEPARLDPASGKVTTQHWRGIPRENIEGAA